MCNLVIQCNKLKNSNITQMTNEDSIKFVSSISKTYKNSNKTQLVKQIFQLVKQNIK